MAHVINLFMASHYPVSVNDVDSTPADSVPSTPRSDLHDDTASALQPRIRFLCSFGGKILPRPHDNQLRYVGGDTRILAIYRHTTFSCLLSKLAKLSGTSKISIKYQLSNEDLDALITIMADEDVENMMEEYDRLTQGQKSARLRLFLFPTDNNDSRVNSINSLLDGSAKRENWFFHALNGRPASGLVLERDRSEVSSTVSEVPDYPFGLDISEDALKESAKILKSKSPLHDSIYMSDPGSPAPMPSSPFSSTSSSVATTGLQVIPDLPPVRTKPVTTAQAVDHHKESEMINEKVVAQPAGHSWHYPDPGVQPMAAVYYAGNVSVQPLRVRAPAQFVQPYAVAPVQVPIGFPGVNQARGAGVRPYELPGRMIADNPNQAIYYGARNLAVVSGSSPVMAVSGWEEMQGSGPEGFRVGSPRDLEN